MKFHLAILCISALAVPVTAQNMTDQEFVNKAAQVNMTEAHIGRLAQQKGHSDAVKQFGQKIESDHKSAYQQLTALNAGVNVPNAIDSEHNSIVQRFEKLSGETFDRQFRELMVEDHQKAVDLFQRAQNQANHAALKNYASQQLPVLRDHLQRAKELGGTLTSQNPATNTANSPNQYESRARTADMHGATPSDQSWTDYGTVTRYEQGKLLELKIRDRIGRHVYNISEGNVAAQIPSDLAVGSQVVLTESIDKNGKRGLAVRAENSAAAGQQKKN